VRATFDQRIARATELAATWAEASALLGFYRRLLEFQKPIFEDLRSRSVTDVRALVPHCADLIELVKGAGTEPLAEFASAHLQNEESCELLLKGCWEGSPGEAGTDPAGMFFAKVLLQPYAEYLASRGDIEVQSESAVCPFCGNRPVVAALRGAGEGGKRSLVCSVCATEWEYRRVLCPNCGEENKDKLPVYTASAIEHVRVEVYLKSVDLTKNGHAVPVVDEVATVALNIWAEEHDYTKLEPNLLGM
jgi:FdhE protein